MVLFYIGIGVFKIRGGMTIYEVFSRCNQSIENSNAIIFVTLILIGWHQNVQGIKSTIEGRNQWQRQGADVIQTGVALELR